MLRSLHRRGAASGAPALRSLVRVAMAAQRSSFACGKMTLREDAQEITPRPTSARNGWASQLDRACFSGAQAAAAITGDDRTREGLTDLPGAAGSPSRLAARQAAAGKLRNHCFSEPIYFAQAPYSGPRSLSDYGERALYGSSGAEVILPSPRAGTSAPSPPRADVEPPREGTPTQRAQFPLSARATATSLAGDGVILGPRGSPMAGEEITTEKKGCLHSPIRRAATEGHTVKELLTSSP